MALDLLRSSLSPLGFGHFSSCNRAGPVPQPPLALGCSGKTVCQGSYHSKSSHFSRSIFTSSNPRRTAYRIPKSADPPSESSLDNQNAPSEQSKASFGYTRKDVLLIGLGVTAFGVALKSGLEFVGVDPLQAGNVVQLVLVLGLTIGWISTYIFRVSNKDMTYAQQLRDYEKKVMEKRLEGLTEAEMEALLEEVNEEKRRLAGNRPIE